MPVESEEGVACQSCRVLERAEGSEHLLRSFERAVLTQRPLQEPDGRGSVRKGAEEGEEAGVGHILDTFDLERKEAIWTVTRRMKWAKGKGVLFAAEDNKSWSGWKLGRKMPREEKQMKKL